MPALDDDENEDEDGGGVATLPPPEEDVATAPPLLLPPHQVIVYNDDVHTFPYVITLLMQVFRMDEHKAVEHTCEIHDRGRAIVWSGSKELGELKVEQVVNFGPDQFASKTVTAPLKAEVVPAP